MDSKLLIGIVVGLLIVIAGLLVTIRFLYTRHKVGKSGQQLLAADLQDEKVRSGIILNSIEDGVVLIDEKGIIQLFNPGASNITGWPATEASGIEWRSVIKLVNEKGEPYDEASHPIKRVMESEAPIRDNTAILVSRNDKQQPISLSLTPLLDKNKHVYAAVAVFRDVTQERQEEKQRSEFISTASHEMRTPVAAIEGYLSLSMNEKVSTIDARARGYLEKAHSSTEHLGQLFQDLLNSAKAEDGRLTSHPVVVEIGAFLEQLSNDLRFVAEKKGLAMEFMVGSSQNIDATNNARNSIKPLYYVKADPDRLREVVTNIFDNAVKYTDSGKVTLGLTGDPNVVQFYVRDTGQGIPAEDIPHLFQKFYRVDNSATRTIGGTGLGLFICRKIIELYQGRIWVESTPGKGSSFFINLPRLSSAAATQAQAQEATTIKPLTTVTTPVVQ
ncbi:MAG: putative sensor protein [Candidatus Saccharibacteria bacterium]|nr:putative sensor protein [Candidatus Saccharibacteria bacterium]